MIPIKPPAGEIIFCECGGKFTIRDLIWQGLHVCHKLICNQCSKEMVRSLPVNQAGIEQYSFLPGSGLLIDAENNPVQENWFSSKLKEIIRPVNDKVDLEVEIFKKVR